MRKKLVNEKREALKKLSPKDLIDRICKYPDQNYLNYDEEGKRRSFPVGMIASDIRDNGYQMSEKQQYGLIHQFAGLTVPEMRVVGVSYRPHNAADYKKLLIESDGTKTTYETDYVLRPEPENPYDSNAVMVMAKRKDGGLDHLGYLSRDFVAAHPITSEMELHGQLVDYSNGKFKNVSYRLGVDMEAVDLMQPMFTDADLNGIGDLSLDRPDTEEYLPDHYIYERPFTVNGSVSDAKEAGAFIQKHFTMTEAMDDEFTTRGLLDCVEGMSWEFQPNGSGIVRLETNVPLDREQKQVADSFVDYLHSENGSLAIRLVDAGLIQPAYPNAIPFLRSDEGFSLVESQAGIGDFVSEDESERITDSVQMDLSDFGISMEASRQGDTTHIYQTQFHLTNPVNDFEAAASYLKEPNMTAYLKDDLKDVVREIEWVLDEEDCGHITVVTERELTRRELTDLSEWILGQNADGLGEGFEQQDFAVYEIEEEHEEEVYNEDTGEYEIEYYEAVTDMCSFDWETNSYRLEDVTPSVQLSDQDLEEITDHTSLEH